MSDQMKEKLILRLQVESLKLDDAEEVLHERNTDLMKIQMERVTSSISQLVSDFDEVCDMMLEENKSLADIKTWKDAHKTEVAKFSEMRKKLDETIQTVKEENIAPFPSS